MSNYFQSKLCTELISQNDKLNSTVENVQNQDRANLIQQNRLLELQKIGEEEQKIMENLQKK